MVLNTIRRRGAICIVLVGLFAGPGCGGGVTETKPAPEPNVGPAAPASAPTTTGKTPAK